MSEKNLVNGQQMPDDLKEFAEQSDQAAIGDVPEAIKALEEEPEEVKTQEQIDAEAKAKLEEDEKKKTESEEEEEEDIDDDLKNQDDKKNHPFVPLAKWNKYKAKRDQEISEMRETHQKEIEELKATISKPEATTLSIDEDLKKFAEENGIEDLNVIKGLVGILSKTNQGIDPEFKKDIETWKEAQKKNAEDSAFEVDFSKTAIPALKKLNPEIDDAHLEEAKKALKELAYDDKYINLSLDEIITLKGSKFSYNIEKKKTVESSRTGSQANSSTPDYENWTAEDIEGASPEDFEKYSNHMASKSGSGRKVLDRNGNEVK